MGHDLETHMNSYARFMSKDLESAFDAANCTSLSIKNYD